MLPGQCVTCFFHVVLIYLQWRHVFPQIGYIQLDDNCCDMDQVTLYRSQTSFSSPSRHDGVNQTRIKQYYCRWDMSPPMRSGCFAATRASCSYRGDQNQSRLVPSCARSRWPAHRGPSARADAQLDWDLRANFTDMWTREAGTRADPPQRHLQARVERCLVPVDHGHFTCVGIVCSSSIKKNSTGSSSIKHAS